MADDAEGGYVDDESRAPGYEAAEAYDGVIDQAEMFAADNILNAVKSADIARVMAMLERNPDDVDMRGAVGETLVNVAYLFNTVEHKAIAHLLIERQPLLLWRPYLKGLYHGENPLHQAIANGDLYEIQWLMETEKELKAMYAELSGPQYALAAGRADGAFFRAGKKTYYGETPLSFAVSMNMADVVEYLVEEGQACIVAVDSLGNTAAHMAVYHNRPEMYDLLEALWEAGKGRPPGLEYVNLGHFVNLAGCSPLVYAAQLGRTELFRKLWTKERRENWSWGPVTAWHYDLYHIDSVTRYLVEYDDEDGDRQEQALEMHLSTVPGVAPTITGASPATQTMALVPTPTGEGAPPSPRWEGGAGTASTAPKRGSMTAPLSGEARRASVTAAAGVRRTSVVKAVPEVEAGSMGVSGPTTSLPTRPPGAATRTIMLSKMASTRDIVAADWVGSAVLVSGTSGRPPPSPTLAPVGRSMYGSRHGIALGGGDSHGMTTAGEEGGEPSHRSSSGAGSETGSDAGSVGASGSSMIVGADSLGGGPARNSASGGQAGSSSGPGVPHRGAAMAGSSRPKPTAKAHFVIKPQPVASFSTWSSVAGTSPGIVPSSAGAPTATTVQETPMKEEGSTRRPSGVTPTREAAAAGGCGLMPIATPSLTPTLKATSPASSTPPPPPDLSSPALSANPLLSTGGGDHPDIRRGPMSAYHPWPWQGIGPSDKSLVLDMGPGQPQHGSKPGGEGAARANRASMHCCGQRAQCCGLWWEWVWQGLCSLFCKQTACFQPRSEAAVVRKALEMIVKGQSYEILMLPNMLALLQRKWDRYARWVFLLRMALSAMFLVAFILMANYRHDMPLDRRAFTCPEEVAADLCSQTRLAEGFVLAFICLRTSLDIRRAYRLGVSETFWHSRGANWLDHWLSALTSCTTLASFVLDATVGPDASRYPFSIAAALGWSSSAYYLLGFRLTGPFVIILFSVITGDLVRFAALLVVILLGFTHAMLFLADASNSYGGMPGAFGAILRQLIHNTFQPELNDPEDDRLFIVPIVAFSFITPVLLINLLIAMLSETFSRITARAEQRWQLERARIILSIEGDMPEWVWHRNWMKYWTKLPEGCFLEVEEYHEERCTSEERMAKLSAALDRAANAAALACMHEAYGSHDDGDDGRPTPAKRVTSRSGLRARSILVSTSRLPSWSEGAQSLSPRLPATPRPTWSMRTPPILAVTATTSGGDTATGDGPHMASLSSGTVAAAPRQAAAGAESPEGTPSGGSDGLT